MGQKEGQRVGLQKERNKMNESGNLNLAPRTPNLELNTRNYSVLEEAL